VDFLPLFFDMKQKPCLVVGGGEVAARKVALLLKAQAVVTVISPKLERELSEMLEDGKFTHEAREFVDADIIDGTERPMLIFTATDVRDVNKRVAELANERGIPVNIADDPENCSFITPSIIDRSPVQIAVSTGGASPVLARMIRTKLEGCIPAGYGRLGALVSNFREKVKAKFENVGQRRTFWESVLNSTIADRVFSGHDDEASAALQKAIDAAKPKPEFQGEVYLVGAGPGDPDLLTFRALRLMQSCDVMVYDRLVSQAIRDLVRSDAELIYVGKKRDDHTMQQENINELLVRLAKEGKRVLRLKGGDPFIFGRGGEEIELLAQEGVPFQVVPGITAAAGCASYSGIPLTHRDYSQACVFVTGHLKDGTVDLNWPALAQPNQTVVFYMGLHGAPTLCKEMMAHGMPGSTPVALIQKGTRPDQKTIISTLDTLEETVKNHKFEPPTLIIVGEVVSLKEKLDWFKPEDPQGDAVKAGQLKF